MKNILVIEDDQAVAELEKDYLELAGFAVDVRNDGSEGLQNALSGRFDLVIVDLMLPGTTGFEICQKVREKFETPLLVVSARSSDIDKIRILALGADDFVTKPFSPAELTARVKAHLGRFERLIRKGEIGGSLHDRIEVRGLALSRSSRQVWFRGKEIPFTAREFELLELFMSQPGKVFSKEEIFGLVWKEQFGDVSTVTVHVRKVREKLGDDPDEPQFIKTVWGMGYRLDA